MPQILFEAPGILLTPDSVILGRRTYALSHVSAVHLTPLRLGGRIGLTAFFLWLFACAAAMNAVTSLRGHLPSVMLIWLMIAGLTGLLARQFGKRARLPRWRLTLVTPNGPIEALTTPNEYLARRAEAAIAQARAIHQTHN